MHVEMYFGSKTVVDVVHAFVLFFSPDIIICECRTCIIAAISNAFLLPLAYYCRLPVLCNSGFFHFYRATPC